MTAVGALLFVLGVIGCVLGLLTSIGRGDDSGETLFVWSFLGVLLGFVLFWSGVAVWLWRVAP